MLFVEFPLSLISPAAAALDAVIWLALAVELSLSEYWCRTYEVRCIVSIVTDDRFDSRRLADWPAAAAGWLADDVTESPWTRTVKGEPRTLLPLYLTVTKYLPGAIGV